MNNKLWYYRNKKGLTLQELSRLSGVSVAALNKIEKIKLAIPLALADG